MSNYKLINGNSLQVLKTFEENSIDSIVCDPPYELGFMGKTWDSTGIAFNKELWAECLRVLKPGGHLISFSGSRTYHRMTVAIEDADFEIRDQIMWVYGSGFPKSLDVSKSIDKKAGAERGTIGTGKAGSGMNPVKGFGKNTVNSKIIKCCRNCNGELKKYKHPDYSYECLICDESFFEFETIDKEVLVEAKKEWNITAPLTEQAKQWDGWGTALKPANEPICLARKPLSEKTVAENVLKWGTGAINIDGCRVPTEDNLNGGSYSKGNYSTDDTVYKLGLKRLEDGYTQPTGRWPANFIHDDLEEEWSKYFYCPKASKKDRNDGLDDFEDKITFNGAGIEDKKGVLTKNNHPTVKPTDLMAYLCKLVTPPGGTVLDPFNGSGSTGKAAIREKFNYVGIDLSQEYLDISKARIEYEISKNK